MSHVVLLETFTISGHEDTNAINGLFDQWLRCLIGFEACLKRLSITLHRQVEAVKWYRNAAEQGYPDAQFALGFMYENGKGIEEDDAEAMRWYRKAAEQGNAYAQCNLGAMYANGEGVKEDDVEAVV